MKIFLAGADFSKPLPLLKRLIEVLNGLIDIPAIEPNPPSGQVHQGSVLFSVSKWELRYTGLKLINGTLRLLVLILLHIENGKIKRGEYMLATIWKASGLKPGALCL
jgi:hypothetical protein